VHKGWFYKPVGFVSDELLWWARVAREGRAQHELPA
jgi:hypothetical protein